MTQKSGRPKFFTPCEVSVHNSTEDIWVSFLGKVYDLTILCERYKGDILLKPILQAGGTDISHWFDTKTKNVRSYIDPVTGCKIPFTPYGRFIHVPPPYPDSSWANDFGRPWWRDESYCIGQLSVKTRRIKIINTLTSESEVLEVCSEETMNEIRKRYFKYNAHASSYTWKYDCRELNMDQTLSENSILDEDQDFYDLGINDDVFLQPILLYYNDDLTEA
ncbi:DgyrCDS8206 [Dimorphilus gyrociliatus]|uniref:Cytochrome b5 domain-containing protein 1 n=1 Tax=Dimorphilus gyrociliatus TaxID=2664684 RepID=A0A7I8VTP4_9ANNE|nr:DgyrCDS8206 [Dimorphilus gyrociliatus]